LSRRKITYENAMRWYRPAAEDKLAQYRMRAQAAFNREKVLR
jgi:hypothetical protein